MKSMVLTLILFLVLSAGCSVKKGSMDVYSISNDTNVILALKEYSPRYAMKYFVLTSNIIELDCMYNNMYYTFINNMPYDIKWNNYIENKFRSEEDEIKKIKMAEYLIILSNDKYYSYLHNSLLCGDARTLVRSFESYKQILMNRPDIYERIGMADDYKNIMSNDLYLYDDKIFNPWLYYYCYDKEMSYSNYFYDIISENITNSIMSSYLSINNYLIYHHDKLLISSIGHLIRYKIKYEYNSLEDIVLTMRLASLMVKNGTMFQKILYGYYLKKMGKISAYSYYYKYHLIDNNHVDIYDLINNKMRNEALFLMSKNNSYLINNKLINNIILNNDVSVGLKIQIFDIVLKNIRLYSKNPKKEYLYLYKKMNQIKNIDDRKVIMTILSIELEWNKSNLNKIEVL